MRPMTERGPRSDAGHEWHTSRVGGHVIRARYAAPLGDAGCTPVVLLHGLGVSSRYMVPLLERVAQHAPCWAPDLPGHGRSQSDAPALRLGELVDVLGRWLEAEQVVRPLLVANSYGCQVVVELVRAGGPASGLMLIGPSTDTAHRSCSQQLGRLVVDMLREPPRLWPVVAADYLRTGPRRTLREFLDGRSHDLGEALCGVEVPVILLRGARDPIAGGDWLARLDAACRHSTRVTIAGHAHCVHYSTPEAVAQLVLDAAGPT